MAQEELEILVVSPRLTIRKADPAACRTLEAAGIHPLLARLWAARGVSRPEETRLGWTAMLPPMGLTHADRAAALAGLGIPVFACTPDAFPDLLAVALRRGDVADWVQQHLDARRHTRARHSFGS